MANDFEWKEFLRISMGAILIGIGVVLIGNSGGKLTQLLIGVVFAGIGIGLIVTK